MPANQIFVFGSCGLLLHSSVTSLMFFTGRSGAAAAILEWVLGFHHHHCSAVDHTTILCSHVTQTDFSSVRLLGYYSHLPTASGSDVCFSSYFRLNLHLSSRASESNLAQSKLKQVRATCGFCNFSCHCKIIMPNSIANIMPDSITINNDPFISTNMS